jgi:hypothetical protein
VEGVRSSAMELFKRCCFFLSSAISINEEATSISSDESG